MRSLLPGYSTSNPLTFSRASHFPYSFRINNTNWTGVLIPLTAASGNTLTITAARAGYDGNMIRLYELHKNSNLYFTPSVRQLSGGSSDATWRITIDFSAEGATDLQKIWMTLAPQLVDSAAYQDQEWEAIFTNWSVRDPQGRRPLKVAGPLSVRIEENDACVRYSGSGSGRRRSSGARAGRSGRHRRTLLRPSRSTATPSTTSTSARGSTTTAASSRCAWTAQGLQRCFCWTAHGRDLPDRDEERRQPGLLLLL